jgi:hypothetical protein
MAPPAGIFVIVPPPTKLDKSEYRRGSLPFTGAGRFMMRLEFISKFALMVFGLVPSRLRVFSKAASIAAEFALMVATAVFSFCRLATSERVIFAITA